METIGSILIIIALILLVGLIANVYFAIKKKKVYLGKKHSAIAVFIAFVLMFSGAAMLPEVDKSAEEANKKREEVAANAKAEEDAKNTYDITSESDIERLVNDLLGDTTNTDEKRVERVIYNELDDSPYIGLNLHANENVTNKLTRGGILKNSFEIMKALHEQGYAGKFYVDWRLPLTDSYGNTEAGKVLSIDITAEDFAKINYDDFLYENLPNIAESYFEHPGFSE